MRSAPGLRQKRKAARIIQTVKEGCPCCKLLIPRGDGVYDFIKRSRARIILGRMFGPTCELIWRGNVFRQDYITLDLSWRPWERDRKMAVSTPDGMWVRMSKIQLLTETDDPVAPVLRSRPINLDFQSDGTYNTIRQWLSTCDEDHQHCKYVAYEKRRPPAHLLDVSVRNNTQSYPIDLAFDSLDTVVRRDG